MMRVLICSQQRTGSNMLRTMLAKQDGLRVGGEVCNGGALTWWPDWTDDPIPPTLVHKTLVRWPWTHVQAAWRHFDVWNLHDRWQWNPNWANEQQIDTLWHDTLLQDPTFKVIWLERENKIDQAVSFMLANQTGQWIQYEGYEEFAPPPHHAFALNRQVAKRLTELFPAYRACIQQKFAPYSLPSISVSYEELCDNPHKTMRYVADFMGFRYRPCEPRTKTTYKTPARQLVSNYHEIVSHIRGT
jgi:LPS sulfotransferase NodH